MSLRFEKSPFRGLSLFLFGSQRDDLREGTKLGGAHAIRPDHVTTVSGPDPGRAGFAELDGPFLGAHVGDLDTEQPGLAAVDERQDQHQVKALDERRRSWISDPGPTSTICAVPPGSTFVTL